MTLHLEVFEATLTKDICTVAYRLQDTDGSADVPVYQIHTKDLVKFITEKELNIYCIDAVTGVYDIADAYSYLQKNTFDVVKRYLEGELV